MVSSISWIKDDGGTKVSKHNHLPEFPPFAHLFDHAVKLCNPLSPTQSSIVDPFLKCAAT